MGRVEQLPAFFGQQQLAPHQAGQARQPGGLVQGGDGQRIDFPAQGKQTRFQSFF